MKKILFAVIYLLIILSFCGCPVSTEYPLGEQGTEKIDKGLVGTWSNSRSDIEVMLARIEARDKYSYKVSVLEKGSNYVAEDSVFTGWITKLDGKKFLCLKGETTPGYYLYHYELKDKNTLLTYDVNLPDGSTEAIKSTRSFRDQVSAAMKKPACFSGEIRFVRK